MITFLSLFSIFHSESHQYVVIPRFHATVIREENTRKIFGHAHETYNTKRKKPFGKGSRVLEFTFVNQGTVHASTFNMPTSYQ